MPVKSSLYHFPWSMNDNPIGWLEITDACNIYCEGCYRKKLSGHKPLEQIKDDIRFFKHWRNPDSITIAGGEPLLHPQLDAIVAYIREFGMKPMLITNAVLLSEARAEELKNAGLFGMTLHIDSRQERPEWEGASETTLNKLRQQYADMLHGIGGLHVVFNSTVFDSTLPEIPAVVNWAQNNIDRVSALAFITFRTATTDTPHAAHLLENGETARSLTYVRPEFTDTFITSTDVYSAVKQACPLYEPAGYLGGTVRHDSYKWLLGVTIGTRYGILGSIGRRTMEIMQTLHHLFRGTYLVYSGKPRVGRKAFILGLFDPAIRRAGKNWFKMFIRRPWRLFSSVYIQGIGIVQAPDILPDGRVDMCENCPDMTVYDGRLVNSCRMDEHRLFGTYIFGASHTTNSTNPPNDP
jgi:organic radical activating enzyme